MKITSTECSRGAGRRAPVRWLAPVLLCLLCAVGPALAEVDGASPATERRLNILLLTVDDMNCDSVGAFGCVVPGTTPNIDRLAAEGMRFLRAHVTIAVCQPCRGALATGRYPHRSGIEGFNRLPVGSPVPVIHEVLQQHGYLIGKLGKGLHADPKPGVAWDLNSDDLGHGRNPRRYYEECLAFFRRAKAEGWPFYLNANSQDPHRPFAGSDQEQRAFRGRSWKPGEYPAPSRTFRPEEVVVPGFLPDLPEIRREIAEYYGSVRRADDTVGAVLRALEESGLADSTLVVFLSDHGMALPFAKTNCYFHSTHTPWIVRWPGHVKAGSREETHFISGIDFMPTALEAAGVPAPEGMDGRSFLPLLRGEDQPGRDRVFTQFHETSARRRYPMRCVQTARYGYIFNPWSDGERVFKNESQSGRTFAAMKAAAADSPAIAARVALFVHRVPEEFYDFSSDPDARHNLIHDPALQPVIRSFRRSLLDWMERTGDPALAALRQRDSEAAQRAFMAAQQVRSRELRPPKQPKKQPAPRRQATKKR